MTHWLALRRESKRLFIMLAFAASMCVPHAVSAQSWADPSSENWSDPSSLTWFAPTTETWLDASLCVWGTSLHSVTLAWTGSGTTYNVYASGISGGPYSRIASGLADTIWSSPVGSGESLFYVVTALDGASDESAYSNEVKAVIPSP